MFDESKINERMIEKYEIEDEKKIKEKEEKNEPKELKELRKKIVKDLNLINSKLEKCKKFKYNHNKIFLLFEEIMDQFEEVKKKINTKSEMNLYNKFMNRFMDLKSRYENISGTEL
jgi:Mg2+ and Co2+ transporter CorA